MLKHVGKRTPLIGRKTPARSQDGPLEGMP
jgi:hypothetical protein